MHVVIERKTPEAWVAAWCSDQKEWDEPARRRLCSRNYFRFTKLAGVRNYSDEPAPIARLYAPATPRPEAGLMRSA